MYNNFFFIAFSKFFWFLIICSEYLLHITDIIWTLIFILHYADLVVGYINLFDLL